MIELLLRLAKAGAAAALGVIVFAIVVVLGEPPSATLGLICWVSAAVFILLVQESPL